MNLISPIEARKRLMKIVSAEVGTIEHGGNNRGKRVVEYQRATWLKPGPWPWCAAFVCWCILQWLDDEEVCAALGIKYNDAAIEKWRPQTAGAFDFERWARSKGLQVLDETAEVRAGDLVVFDFSHIGFVAEDAHTRTLIIHTTEGNTNGKGLRDSLSGDGVWPKDRERQLARTFIRLI